MFFVIDKPQFQRVIAIVRDDRRKEDQGLAGPCLRLEARDDYVKLHNDDGGRRQVGQEWRRRKTLCARLCALCDQNRPK